MWYNSRMFEQLVGPIIKLLGRLSALQIIPSYDAAVVLRWGRYQRVLGPGLAWTWPLAESVLTCPSVPTTLRTETQSVGAHSFSMVARWRITDPRTYLLDSYDQDEIAVDCLLSGAAAVMSRWDGEGRLPNRRVLRAANRRAALYGFEFERAELVNCVRARAIRLLQD